MPEEPITPVILCGGSGFRLWPRSRPATPKPFLPLVGDETLFQEALKRTADAAFADAIVVAGAAHIDFVEEQSRGFGIGEIIVEPQPRQTAAAIALAALRVDADSVILVCPSDHHVTRPAELREAAVRAARLARDGWLVCLGVTASSPDTHFGYIRRGEAIGEGGFQVSQFVEKPDEERAADYVASGEFAWNAGIFAFRAGDYLRELQALRPALSEAVRRSVSGGKSTGGRFHPDAVPFGEIDPESVDYAVMENTDRAALVMGDMGWSDIGNWDAVYRIREKDEFGNSVRGPAELIDCANVLVDSDGPRVHVIGVDDLVVVVDGEDIVVASSKAARHVGQFQKQ